MNAQVTVETINPTTAKQWLANRWGEQRPLRDHRVTQFATEIKNGKFKLTSDAVVLVKGKLANGQHRLSGVVEAQKSAPFIVMRSNDEELYKVIDCGMMRTLSDVIGNVPYSKSIVAAARLVIVYDLKLLSISGYSMDTKTNPVTRTAILEYVEKYNKELSDQASFIAGLYNKSRVIGAAVATAFLHIASRQHPQLAKEFIDHVYSGDFTDASLDFRNRMMGQMRTRARLRQAHVFALLIKAWKSFKNGTRPGALRMHKEEQFPEI